jgi:hypothetical protein
MVRVVAITTSGWEIAGGLPSSSGLIEGAMNYIALLPVKKADIFLRADL